MQRLQQYLKEVVQELKKVTWPTWEELKGSTMVVVFFSVVMGLYVAAIDLGLAKIVEAFL